MRSDALHSPSLIRNAGPIFAYSHSKFERKNCLVQSIKVAFGSRSTRAHSPATAASRRHLGESASLLSSRPGQGGSHERVSLRTRARGYSRLQHTRSSRARRRGRKAPDQCAQALSQGKSKFESPSASSWTHQPSSVHVHVRTSADARSLDRQSTFRPLIALHPYKRDSDSTVYQARRRRRSWGVPHARNNARTLSRLIRQREAIP